MSRNEAGWLSQGAGSVFSLAALGGGDVEERDRGGSSNRCSPSTKYQVPLRYRIGTRPRATVTHTPQTQALIDHLVAHSVRTDGPFLLRSGERSDWYMDARQTTFAGIGARLVGAAVLEHLPEGIDAVGGMTLGADPIAVATAIAAADAGRDIAAFSIRKEEKDHGTEGRLVGPVGPGAKVVVLEDTTTTGGALGEAVDVLQDSFVLTVLAIALVDRSNGATAHMMERRGIDYIALTTPADFGIET
jgi:orotate phosphoribosyltransferase